MFDNMAFYDSVAIIAGRSIVTIDPLPEKQRQPIVHQPKKLVRWFEDDNSDSEILKENIPVIVEDKCNVSTSSDEISQDTTDSASNLRVEPKADKEDETGKTAVKNEQRSPSISKLGRAQTLAVIDDEIKMRKKSLRERRMSRSQTFNFNTNSELPLIRQLSMPKFYLDTPDIHQKETTIVRSPSMALMSPVQPVNQFSFDLRSVVQMEKEKDQSRVPVHVEPERSSRLAHMRGKLIPLKIKGHSPMSNVPNSTVYM